MKVSSLMTWALATYLGNSIKPFQNLTEEELNKYRKASDAVFEFAQDMRIYAFQKSNYDDFTKLLGQYSKDEYLKGIIGKVPINPEVDKMLIELNRHLLNLLSTIRTFRDYADYNLKKRYGKNSKLVSIFKNAYHEEYSNCFSYRFIYNLRNCAQHCLLPLELSLVSRELEPYSGKIENSIVLKLSRDKLLNSGYKWRKLRKEVEKLPDQFEVSPHLSEMEKCIDRIQSAILKGKSSFLTQDVDYIRSLFKDKLEEDTPCLTRFNDTEDCLTGKTSKHKLELSWVPVAYMKIIDKLKTVE